MSLTLSIMQLPIDMNSLEQAKKSFFMIHAIHLPRSKKRRLHCVSQPPYNLSFQKSNAEARRFTQPYAGLHSLTQVYTGLRRFTQPSADFPALHEDSYA